MSQERTHKINVLVAPNSMKGSLDAFRFTDAIEAGLKSVSELFEIIKMPVADGGDFTFEVLQKALNLNVKKASVLDPLGRTIEARYGIKNDLAVIEMANASGMKLLSKHELNPFNTSTFGTGQLIANAVENGARKILIGIGGSATVDGGMGLLEALGIKFFDVNGQQVKASGRNLGKVKDWDCSEITNLEEIDIEVICDVDNPLLGDNGAVNVFAPQKGATNSMLPILEENLNNFAKLIQEKKNISLPDLPGMGAAGGINLALSGFLDAKIKPGAELILDLIGFNEGLTIADCVITGEGKIDAQTKNMKAPFVVSSRAKMKNITTFAIGGIVTHEGKNQFDKTFSLVNDESKVKFAMRNAEELVIEKSKHIGRTILEEYGRN